MVEIVEAEECAAQKQEGLVDVRRPLVAARRHQAGFRTSSWVRASETSLAPASVSAPTRAPHYTSVSSTRVSSAKRARKRSAYGWAFWESGVGADATAVHQVSSSHHLQPRASSPAARRKVLCQGPLGITRGLELSQPRGRAVPRRVEVLYEHRGQAFIPRGIRRRACHTGSACGRVEAEDAVCDPTVDTSLRR